MIAPNPSLDAALELLDRGLAVIPVPHREKAPRIKEWPDLRLDREACFARFANDPQNVGVLMGEPSGWVVDVDLDDELALELADEHLPETAAVFGRDSRPRSHRLYRVTAPVETRKWKSSAGMIVELRSTGTQTIAPGSVHPSGEFVSWDTDGPPIEIDPCQLVEALESLARAVRARKGGPERSADRSRNARNPVADDDREARCRAFIAERCRDSIEGQRGDDALFRVACETVRFGLDRASAERVMGDFNRERCSPPWPEERLRYKLDEAEKAATRGEAFRPAPTADPSDDDPWPEPMPLPDGADPPVFPLERVFPEASAKAGVFVGALAEALQVPPELPGLLVLPVTSLAISGRAVIEVAPGWIEPAPIWTLTMLGSGERKSAAFQSVLGAVLEWERAEAERMRPTIARAEELKRISEQRLKTARRDAAQADDDAREALSKAAQTLAEEVGAMTVPRPPQLRTGEPTPEAVADLMQRNGERLLLAAPEAGAFDTMMGRYQRGVPNFDVYLCGHAGDALSMDRKHGGSIHLARPELSVAMTVQPVAVRDLLSNPHAKGRGLIGRFMLSCPAGRVGARAIHPDPLPEHLADAWARWITHLLELHKPERPTTVRLSAEAHRAMSGFRQELEPRLGPAGDLNEHSEFGSKLPGLVARIALTLFALGHWARPALSPAGSDEIGIDEMNAAIAWGRWAIDAHTHALSAVGADADLELARKCARWIARHDRPDFTRRDLFTARRTNAVRHPEDLNGAIDILIEHGWIRPSARRARTGRPAERCEINPGVREASACTNGGVEV
ncbi:MAG: DUF3987 domain-containing protein [Phycisphaerales bacterium]